MSSAAGEIKRLALHFSQETSQTWSQVPPGRGNDGAAIWLPNRVLVELQMIPPSSRGSAADREEGMQGASGRGLLLTFSWAVKPDTVIGAPRPPEHSLHHLILASIRSRGAAYLCWDVFTVVRAGLWSAPCTAGCTVASICYSRGAEDLC